jgi:hypothetical protein
MTPLQEQFKILKAEYPQAELKPLPDGSHLIVIPGIKLSSAWSKPTVEVKFVAPVGYPFGRPDCFWTDHDLRLSNGNPPQSTGPNAIPNANDDTPHLWFSWHLSAWNPNSDNLLTYLNVIKSRFNPAR